MTVDYTALFEPTVRLRPIRSQGGYFVIDQHGNHYTLAPVDLPFAIKFMRRFAERHGAELDEGAIEYARCMRIFGEYPKPGSGPLAGPVPVTSAAPHGELTPDPDFSVRVPSNVYPLWKDTA